MCDAWTQERKAKQRAAIYRWRPWEKSTGPKTPAGKQTVARNALKHGNRSREKLALLAEARQWLRDLR